MRHRKTLRRMDGTRVGNVRGLVQQYLMRQGRRKRTRTSTTNGPRTVQKAGSSACDCCTPHAQNACSFVFEDFFLAIVKKHRVFFRIRHGSKEPRNADGRLAWTTEESNLSDKGCRIRVTYRPKDSNKERDEYVPVSSLDLCAPAMKEDVALVIWGDDKGCILYPSHANMGGKGTQTGIYCKLNRTDKKRDAKLYDLCTLTRARAM